MPVTRSCSWLFGVLATLAIIVTLESVDANPNDARDLLKQRTEGLLGSAELLLWPINKILYTYLDSLLRNLFGVGLPCTLLSIMPFQANCTPIP